MAQIHFRSIFSLIKASNFHIRDFLVAQRSCRWKCFHSFSIEFGGAYWWLFRGEPKGGSKRRDTTPINREFAALLSKIFHQLEEKFEIQTERFSFFLFGFFSSPMSSSHSLKVRKKNWFRSQVKFISSCSIKTTHIRLKLRSCDFMCSHLSFVKISLKGKSPLWGFFTSERLRFRFRHKNSLPSSDGGSESDAVLVETERQCSVIKSFFSPSRSGRLQCFPWFWWWWENPTFHVWNSVSKC